MTGSMTRTLFLPAAALALTAGLAIAQVPPGVNALSNSADASTIDGTVREIFGNKFIIEDANGRKLVETGPRGQEAARVAVGDKVKVEGVARDGFTHATAITLANGQRVAIAGPPGGANRGGPPAGRDVAYDQRSLLEAVTSAGYRDPRIQDVKKHHAEVIAADGAGKQWELHVEFDGRIRKRESLSAMNEADIKGLIENAGYKYAGSMRPEKKHMVVTATNNRGERVEIDVHRDGSIKKEKRVFN